MSTTSVVSTTETPMYLASGEEHIFAVLTLPTTPLSDLGAIFVHSGNKNFSTHRNRLWNRLARAAAAEGIPTLRIDITGSGESSGVLERTANGQPVDDVLAAGQWLLSHHCSRIAFVGSCYGSILALAAGGRLGPSKTAGVVTMGAPIVAGRREDKRGKKGAKKKVANATRKQVLKRLVADRGYRGFVISRVGSRIRGVAGRSAAAAATDHPTAKWVATEQLAKLNKAAIPVKLFYGDEDFSYRWLQLGRTPALDALLAAPTVSLDVLEGPLNGMPDIEVQDRAIGAVAQWLGDLAGGQRAQPTP